MTDYTESEDIGALLRAQREKLGYSLEAAAEHTRIRKCYLVSLEENQFSELPGRAYVVGFVRVYARYLGLDSNELLSHLEDHSSNESPGSSSPSPPITRITALNKAGKNEGWGAFVLGFLVVLLLGAAAYLFVPAFQVSDDDKTPAKPVVVEPTETPKQAELPKADTEVETLPPVSLEESEPVPAAVSNPPEFKAFPAILEEGSSLRMLALSESTLVIQLDDRTPHRYRLYDGLDLTWKVKSKVSVEFGETGAAQFWLDGQEVKLGEKTTFLLQQSAGE